MPTAKTKLQTIDSRPVVQNNKLGFLLSVFLPFDEMGNEREGKGYVIPLKARAENGDLLKSGDGKQLYALADGTTTDSPYVGTTRILKGYDANGERDKSYKGVPVKVEAKKATPHIDWAKTVQNPEIVWPDGKMRDIGISIKCNNPRTPEEFKRQKEAATATRRGAAIETASLDDLLAMQQKLAAELAKRQAPAPPAA
jgi:hypothetical protein